MDIYTYNCNYCGVEYTPKRRFKQKYCSSSCRVNAFNRRKKKESNLPNIKENDQSQKSDKMSWSGVGNAAVGSLATNLVTSLLTKDENKPATKGDIQNLLNSNVNGMVFIKNLPPAIDGSRAYFDTFKQTIIYKK